ncbi:DUF943 family protein [Nissabacter sp. SGAir0207]|uniref:DUF943 family protein n=1 Tax=Nissabacter sp. SGAir0207 TaxID=2126321 RepID=UPI0010CCEE1C|nr:DUF943 family protein [Nissabacter sp. SGAir0207]QCR38405.1 hypothetical protein C1N62_19900 [Nissabacter sp. SGAir0207]
MNKRLIASVIVAASCGYLLWQYLIPVEIVAAHGASVCNETSPPCHGDILIVRHFPYLKSRQIAWWRANKDMIQSKYGIPHNDTAGYYSVTIMEFGDGYRTEPNESLLFFTDEVFCFYEMEPEARCIDRNILFNVSKTPNSGLKYKSY